MSDVITIHDLEIWTHIGVPESERASPQRVLVSVELSLDTKEAGQSDDVTKSIDYADIAKQILELAKTERKTIECLAEDIATSISTTTSNAQRVTSNVQVTVTKFPLPEAKAVSITIKR
ncbi:MAG: dihydroneopterin aldolase [bacterium]|nr:dihydroneopterin aldolase [bacterium]